MLNILEFIEKCSDKFGENLAEVIDDNELNTIAQELIASYEEDLDSRNDWFRT